MQRETAGDQELNLKKRARRRLVGAIALVLLMIIVLPMILKDRAATQPQDNITITLQNEQVPAEASDFDSNIVPTEPAPLPETVMSKPEAVLLPEPVIATPDPEAVSSKTDVPPAPKDTPKLEQKPNVDASKPDTSKPAASKPTVTPPQQFHVQIGVFSDAANVKQLQAKLSDLGYKSQTQQIDTAKGKKIRLKTQVFGDRNEAAIALENIKDAGLTGMVVSQ